MGHCLPKHRPVKSMLPLPDKEPFIFKPLRILTLVIALAWGLGGLAACSGMTGLGGAPGGFADGGGSKDESGSGGEAPAGEPGAAGNTLGGYRPGSDGVPTGLTKMEPPSSGGGSEAPGAASQYTIANSNPFGGYRPGNDGQVQRGHNVTISVSALDGRSNCRRPLDAPLETLFPEAGTPMVYWWLSQEENGPYIPTGYQKSANEYGRVVFSCIDYGEETTYYKHALILVSYTDAQGRVHRSEKLPIVCPDIQKYETAEFCLSLEAPTPTLRGGAARQILLQNPDNASSFQKVRALPEASE